MHGRSIFVFAMALLPFARGYSSSVGDMTHSRRQFIQTGVWVSAASVGTKFAVAEDNLPTSKDIEGDESAKAARLKAKIAASKQNYRKADSLFSQR
jgi:hypothetical protein